MDLVTLVSMSVLKVLTILKENRKNNPKQRADISCQKQLGSHRSANARLVYLTFNKRCQRALVKVKGNNRSQDN